MNKRQPKRRPDEGLPAEHPDRIAYNFDRWREAMELSHAMLMAGLRDKVGPDGDLHAAYDQWNRARRRRKLAAYEKAAKRYFERTSRLNTAMEKDDATGSCD